MILLRPDAMVGPKRVETKLVLTMLAINEMGSPRLESRVFGEYHSESSCSAAANASRSACRSVSRFRLDIAFRKKKGVIRQELIPEKPPTSNIPRYNHVFPRESRSPDSRRIRKPMRPRWYWVPMVVSQTSDDTGTKRTRRIPIVFFKGLFHKALLLIAMRYKGK